MAQPTECECPTKDAHDRKLCPFEYKTYFQKRRETLGKRTSEGYKPDDNEKVELRGD